MRRVVLDTNVWLSAIFWKREASKIVELGEKSRIKIIVSKNILLEIVEVLEKEKKFQEFMEERRQNIEDLLRTIISITELVSPKSKINVIKEHPKDNIVLEAALEGKASDIISYNKHVLNLGEFRGIKISKPKEFFNILES